MDEVTIYLDKTTETEFHNWLFDYGNNAPTFKQKPVILFDSFEFEGKERLRVTIRHDPGAANFPPVVDLLKAIAQDWQETRRDVLQYVKEHEKKYNIVIDTSHFPADLDAAQPIYPLLAQDAIERFWIEKGVMTTISDHYANELESYKKLGMKVDLDALRIVAKLEHDAPQVGAGEDETGELNYEAILKREGFKDTTGWDMTLITLWNEGRDRAYIAGIVHKAPQRVTNRISELRRIIGNEYGEIVLPKNTERKKRMIKSRYTA